jgi:hypothetical protein
MGEPSTYYEAYIAEILGDIVRLKGTIEHTHATMDRRIGITQEIIDTHLNEANKALQTYTKSASLQSNSIKNELASAKTELAHITNQYLRNAIKDGLIQAHFELQQRPYPFNKNALMRIALFASVTGCVIGALSASLVIYLTA